MQFVVQKHDARRLHYDLRLELDGVLKSWAVTKGPSLVPGEKRLAVEVEDHPLDYGDFEGTIPKGEYGGGTVIVWDKGSWRPLHDPAKSLAKGHLDFELSGEKLKGRWHLVRMARKPREKHDNWLLIKGDDEAARAPQDADILDERPESAKTGRSLADVAGKPPAPVDPTKCKGARKAALPRFVEPALASLTARPPTGERWLHEIKFDGYRIQARIENGRVALMTRSGHRLDGEIRRTRACGVAGAAGRDRPARRRTCRREAPAFPIFRRCNPTLPTAATIVSSSIFSTRFTLTVTTSGTLRCFSASPCSRTFSPAPGTTAPCASASISSEDGDADPAPCLPPRA